MSNIVTLKDFVSEVQDRLSMESVVGLKDVMQRYSGDDWKDYCRYDSKEYQRSYIHKSDEFELLVLSWDCNQFSLIHDHPANGCLIKVLSGTLVEKLFKGEVGQLEIIAETEQPEPNISYIDNNRGYHILGNASNDTRAASLHLYAPGNYNPNYFTS